MAEDAFESRQDTHGIHGLAAPFGMRQIAGVPVIGGAVQPVSFAADIDSGFIGMNHCCHHKLLPVPVFKAFKALVGLQIEIAD